MNQYADQRLTVADLSTVVFSAGRVFNDLSASRPATEEFLRTGKVEGISSAHDLALLEDLRDLSQLAIDHGQARGSIDTGFVRCVNARITRSGALHPGELRRSDQGVGVSTHYGEHMSPAITETDLQQLLDRALRAEDPREQALDLFVTLAKAQPFEDGNKRTAIFVANGLLIRERPPMLLTLPLDGVQDIEHGQTFNDLLARSYIYDDDTGVKNLMRSHGLRPRPDWP
ncbi:Fic family protein [Nesterenkonia halotolerans]|uniref:Fic family protein n=1 Tax=Nesterenkonia halotolerans TaxID=225325 RepID=UPI003EE56CD7